MEIIKKGNVQFLISEKIKTTHGFTIRDGGVSCGDFDSLNVGLRRGDNPFNVFKNLEICCDALKLTKEKLTLTHQLHTSSVQFVDEADMGKGLIREWGEGVDGIVTNLKNVPLMCYSADCVPILLYDDEAQLIGAVHSGWRGTAQNIVKNAIKLMCSHGSNVKNISAFIGPAIGLCCYEVSNDVAEAFLDYGECVIKKDDGKFMLDLKNIVKAQIVKEGVSEDNIDVAPYCTSCDNNMFFSHRRQNGKSGLLGGFIQR